MSDFTSIGIKVDASDVEKATVSLDKMAGSGKGAEKSLDGTGTSIKAVGAAAAIAATATIAFSYAMIKTVQSAIDAADAMNDLHLKTGLAFKDLAAYDILARQSGTSINEVAGGLKFLGKYMVEHSGNLKQIGVTSKDTNIAMQQFADVIQGIKDPAIKSALAMEVLGRSGVEMIPFLSGGSAAMMEAKDATIAYGNALEIVAPQADRLNDKLAEIKINAETTSLGFAATILPTLNILADELNETAKGGEFLQSVFNMITISFQSLVVLVANVAYVFKAIGTEIGGIAAQAAAIATFDFAGAAAIGKAMREDAEKSRKEIDAFSDRILNAKAPSDEKTKSAQSKDAEALEIMVKKEKELRDTRHDSAEEYIKSIENETEKIGASWFLLKRINLEYEIKNKHMTVPEATEARAAMELQIQKQSMENAFKLQEDVEKEVLKIKKNATDDIAEYELQIAKNKEARDIEDIAAIKLEKENAAKQLESRMASTGASAVTSAFFADNGKSFTDNFTNSLKKSIEPAFNKLIATLIQSAIEGKVSASAKGDWIMTIIAIIATQFGNEAIRKGSFSTLTATQAGATAGTKNDMMQLDAQWFTAQLNWNETMRMSRAELNKYSDAIVDISVTMYEAGDALGYTNLSAQSFNASVNTSGDVLKEIAKTIGNQLIPSLVLFQREGEDLSQTAKRITDTFNATNNLLNAIGVSSEKAFGGFGLQSAAARESIIAASGGLSEFNSNSKSFIDNFLTPAQKLAPALDDVARMFNKLGIEGVTTNEQFAELVKAQLELGNTTVVAQLLTVSDSFNEITKSAGDANKQINALLNKDLFATLVDYTRAMSQNGAGSIAGAQLKAASLSQQEQAGTAAYTAENSAAIASALKPIMKEQTDMHWQGVSKFEEALQVIMHAINAIIDTIVHWLKSIFDTLEHWFSVIVDTFSHWFKVIADAISGVFGGGSNESIGEWFSGGGGKILPGFGWKDGGAFGTGNVHAFASGGTFTNEIYSDPTLFKFAHGNGFSQGVMGEAGAEAVMPLRRNSSGQLGIIAANSSSIELISEIRALREEVQSLRKENMSGQVAIAANTGKTAKLHDRWNNEGMPEVRLA